MSDPTIQTFCCHHSGAKEDIAVKIMNEFNTNSYNIVCILSSLIGVGGALFQISSYLYKRIYSKCLKLTPIARGQYIIFWLAVSDFFAASGILLRSALWLRYKNIMPMPSDDVSVLFCSIVSAWSQYFYTVTWFWTLFYGLDTWLTLNGRYCDLIVYHSIAWGVPAATTSIGLSFLYFPDAKCHNLASLGSALLKVLPNYCATYIPIMLVMAVNPVMYILASKSVETAVTLPLAQFTSKERKVVDILRLKFLLINIVFYVCWVPNLINGLLLWTMWYNIPIKMIVFIWYIMAVMNPLQAFFNALVYQPWNLNDASNHAVENQTEFRRMQYYDEKSPLLGSQPPNPTMFSTNLKHNYETM